MTGFKPRTSGAEATALPTEPQPLSRSSLVYSHIPTKRLILIQVFNLCNFRIAKSQSKIRHVNGAFKKALLNDIFAKKYFSFLTLRLISSTLNLTSFGKNVYKTV